ncbi:GNAT family N-acetyltransferase [Demequina salsinemoris]|uniref:GNAT family N-acetyltransferase n=1 Tax=Demequina salsinemoris TaxID=577470 RepID=UPI000784B1FF|nr:GNAT family N-acetyltransferase [Demequina salsinemoris]
MSVPAGYQIVSLDQSRSAEMLSLVEWAFAFRLEPTAMRSTVPWEHARALEITDPARGPVGTFCGVHSSHSMSLRMPGGGTMRASGLTWVSVHPAHRRRGILTTMIADHFSRALARGEAVSVLYAAETAIYPRFGYAMAAAKTALDLGRSPKLRPVPGSDDLPVRIETIDMTVHADVVRAVQRRLDAPGSPVEIGDSVAHDALLNLTVPHPDAEEQRIVIVEDAEGPAAYAVLSRSVNWSEVAAAGTVEVKVWGAADSASTRRLFSVVADLDLMASCKITAGGADTLLLQLLEDPRGIGMREFDGMWLRILDVPAALASRTYSADLDVVIEVSDALLASNEGRWKLSARADATPMIERTDAPCDLRLGIDALSAALLGGTSLEALRAAGRVEEESPGSVRSASRAFRSDREPICNLSF